MTEICTLALDADRTCGAPAIETWTEFGCPLGVCLDHSPRTVVEVNDRKHITVPAGVRATRNRYLWGTGDAETTERVTQHERVARLVAYWPGEGRALVDYVLGGCGSFETLHGVVVEFEGVELPDGSVPSYTRSGRCTRLAVEGGAVVTVEAPSLFA